MKINSKKWSLRITPDSRYGLRPWLEEDNNEEVAHQHIPFPKIRAI